jgi:uncharacterized protein YaiE (UPF0345 family)
MTVVSGKLAIKLLGSDDRVDYGPNETFTVDANVKFQVKTDEQTAYLCLYR